EEGDFLVLGDVPPRRRGEPAGEQERHPRRQHDPPAPRHEIAEEWEHETPLRRGRTGRKRRCPIHQIPSATRVAPLTSRRGWPGILFAFPPMPCRSPRGPDRNR